jgi:outer membrane protein TolC
VAALQLSCCATAPSARPDPGQSAASLEARSLDDAKLETFFRAATGEVHPSSSWDLNRLTLAAVYFHPDIQIAYAKLAEAQAGVETARQRPNPSLSLTPQYNVTTAIPSPWLVGATVTFLVEAFGRRPARIEQAHDLVEAARQDVASASWQVRGKVRGALIDNWIADQKLAAARTRLVDEEELVGLLERRRSAGDASRLDLAKEQANRDQTALAVRDGERAATLTKAQLAEAVGVPAQALDHVTLNYGDLANPPAVPAEVPSQQRRQALIARTDIQAALAQYLAADANLRAQTASRFPNLNLGPAYTFDSGDHEYGLTLTSDLPIFNQNQGPIAEALAQRKMAAAELEAAQVRAMAAIDTAVAGYAGASRTLAAAERLLAGEQKHEARNARLFQVGAIDRPTWLAGEVELRGAEASRLDALAVQRQALGRLEDALQTPLLTAGSKFAPPDTNPRPQDLP